VYARECLKALFPIPVERFAICADLYLSLRCVRYGPVLAYRRALGCYRIHRSNHYRSTDLFVLEDEILKNRIAAHVLRFEMLEREAVLSMRKLPVSAPMFYTTFYGWLDLLLAQRLLGEKTIEPYTGGIITAGIEFRLNKDYSDKWIKRWMIALFFLSMERLPLPLLKIGLKCVSLLNVGWAQMIVEQLK